MPCQIPVAEAKKSFSDLIRRAEAGEEIELTRYGRPVARLVASVPVPSGKLIGCLAGAFPSPDMDQGDEDVRALFAAGPVAPE